MDQATQQNAAMVEEMSAAANALRTQAAELVEAVAQFKITGDQMRAKAPPPVQAALVRQRPLSQVPAPTAVRAPTSPAKAAPPALNHAQGSDDWESF